MHARVKLTGTLSRLDGSAHAGTVQLIPSRSPIYDSGGQVVISGAQRFPLDLDGSFTAELPASNDPTLGPAFTYELRVDLGVSHVWRVKGIEIPMTRNTIDLTEVSSGASTPGVPTVVVELPAGGDEGDSLVRRDNEMVWERLLTEADADILAGHVADAEAVRDEITGMIDDLPTMENVQDMFATVVPKFVNMTRPAYIVPGWNIPVDVVMTPDGEFTASIDHEALHTRGDGTTVYVDPINGSDSNDGLSWATAKKNPASALYDGANYGVAELIVRGGFYARNASPKLGFRPDVIIRAEPGTRPIFTQGDASTAWANHSGNVWQVGLSGTGTVYDQAILDSDGLPTILTEVDSLTALASTPGGSFRDGTTQYVHLSDGRTPDADVLVDRSTYALNTQENDPGLPLNILVEGIEFWGGEYARLKAYRAGDTFIAKNCAWRYAKQNGVGIQGFETTVLVDCEATDNGNDGFNYHVSGELSGQVLEIGCIGARNGRLPGSSQNGSTAHGTYKIVRVNCIVHDNPGPQFADVNNVHSLNYGCVAYDALGYPESTGPESAGIDFTAPELGGKLTLIGGSSTSEVAIRNASNAEVFGFTWTGTHLGGSPKPYLSV